MSQTMDSLVAAINGLASGVTTLIADVEDLLTKVDPADAAKATASLATVNDTLTAVQAEIDKLAPPAGGSTASPEPSPAPGS